MSKKEPADVLFTLFESSNNPSSKASHAQKKGKLVENSEPSNSFIKLQCLWAA